MRLVLGMMTACVLACASAAESGGSPAADTARPAAVRPAPIAPTPPPASEKASDTSSVAFDASGHPVLPLVFANDCQGEDCATSFAALVCAPTELRAAAADSAPVAARLSAGDSVRVVRRDLRVSAVGVVVLRKAFVLDYGVDMETDAKYPRSDTVRFARGDTLYVVRYGELGAWGWAYRGVQHYSSQFWAGAPDQSLGDGGVDSAIAVARSSPKTEDWWFVKSPGGATGWWHAQQGAGSEAIVAAERSGAVCPSPDR